MLKEQGPLDGWELKFLACELDDAIPSERKRESWEGQWEQALKELWKCFHETRDHYHSNVCCLQAKFDVLEARVDKLTVEAEAVFERRPTTEYSTVVTCQVRPEVSSKRHTFHRASSRQHVEFSFVEKGATLANGVPLLTSNLHDAIAQDCVYILSDTIWDAVIFCGLGVMSLIDELVVGFIYLANFIAQGMFIVLVYENMTDSAFSDSQIVETMRDWRILYAHDPDFGDLFTTNPLAKDVCERSNFLMEGSGQSALFSEIYDYLNTFFGMRAGAVLCLLSVSLWLLTCWQEFSRLALFFIGIWTPREKSSSIKRIRLSSVEVIAPIVVWEHDEATQKNFQLHLSYYRAVVMSLMIVLPRLFIVACLCHVGILFLVSTIQLNELILNAVALEVVLNIDELFFQAFVPRMAWRMIRKTMPLRVPRMSMSASSYLSIMNICVVLLVSGIVWLALILPSVNTMHETKKVMCDGDLDFFAVQLKYGPVIVAAPTSASVDRSSFAYRAILQRIGLHDFDPPKLYSEGTPFNVARTRQHNPQEIMNSWRGRSIEEWAGSFKLKDLTLRPCMDDAHASMFGFDSSPTWLALQDLTGNSSLRSCVDSYPYCSHAGAGGQVVRLICPVTCGGDNAFSGQPLIEQIDGMPAMCSGYVEESLKSDNMKYELPAYARSIRENCTEPSPSELRELSAWRLFYTAVNAKMRRLLLSFEGTDESFVSYWENELINGMTQLGCEYFVNQRIIPVSDGITLHFDHCDRTNIATNTIGRTIEPLCPLTCRCPDSLPLRNTFCPRSCLNVKLGSPRE